MTKRKIQKILENHIHWIRKDTKDWKNMQANLYGVDLRKISLHCTGLVNILLTYANLSHTNLQNADLRYADLSYANLSYADLTGANLDGANLEGTDLSFANLTGIDLKMIL